MSTLLIRRLGFRYGIAPVLRDVSLELRAGETLALVGASGCGKSTLLHLVAGLLDPSEGRIHSGFRGVGCVFQQPRLMPWKTVQDNLALGLKGLGMPAAARRRRALDWLRRMGLAEADAHRFPHELSGGMQSRVALGRALAVAPELLLLDEPFAALDVGLKQALYALLRHQVARTGAAVLMITHDLMEAVRLADRVAVMVPEPGRIVGEFALSHPQSERTTPWVYRTVARLMAEPVVRDAFGLVPDAAQSDAAQSDAAQSDAVLPGEVP